jgi:hypothetical protein
LSAGTWSTIEVTTAFSIPLGETVVIPQGVTLLIVEWIELNVIGTLECYGELAGRADHASIAVDALTGILTVGSNTNIDIADTNIFIVLGGGRFQLENIYGSTSYYQWYNGMWICAD